MVTIGYIGRFTHQKGIHRIIDIVIRLMNDYKDVKIAFVGQPSIEYENIINELEKHTGFKYLGFLPSSIDFYSQVDIVLVPSLWESGSIVVLEAMAAGKVVIASNINPHTEYIEHGKTGFLANVDEDFYKYCIELIHNKELIQTIGRNANTKAKEYDWINVFSKTEEMYKSILKP